MSATESFLTPSALDAGAAAAVPPRACYARAFRSGACPERGTQVERQNRVERAKVAELADAPDLGSGSRKAMGVRLPPFASASARGGGAAPEDRKSVV